MLIEPILGVLAQSRVPCGPVANTAAGSVMTIVPGPVTNPAPGTHHPKVAPPRTTKE
ncbi:MAG: hypothetical protein SOR94_01135 [Lawsonella sp.]|uniref:hypothetical protein n=1 Tax=Lawsonella sp. TaxID=2041415 RepID=UPI0025F9A8DA|nr:hypothetical protein [Lawsonella sp.]MDY2978630.1 hypothetical protein [Lawsonella sp.]